MDMDTDTAARVPSPTPSSGSDSDSYNTESARIYFGPLKTPERKFVSIASKRLFPPPSNSSLRRSPRLSSPRPRSATPTDAQTTREDLEDIEQVAQLVHESEEEDESMPTSSSGTPQNGEVFIDEPSSALADKVLNALDNPSPPPSPPPALSLFDPYHTTVPEVSSDYQADLMSLTITDKPEVDDENPLLITSADPLLNLPPLSSSIPETSFDEGTAQENLISFDSFMTPPKQNMVSVNVADEVLTAAPSVILSVDDLLAQSPSPENFAVVSPLSAPAVTIQAPEDDVRDVGSPMAVDNDSLPDVAVDAMESLPVPSTPEASHSQQDGPSKEMNPTSTTPVEETMVTPLRRSTRPRRSVTPNPPPAANILVVSPPSVARTQVRRKSIAVDPKDEVVSDSQDEGEDQQKLPSRATPITARVRHRSPGKAPLSFQRELGSLSPTSTNVLSSLAFNPTDDSSVNASDPTTSETSQPVFSFSVFAPPVTAGPSTPVRNTGPIRFASSSKGQTSPNKYRIQTPAPNDPTVTPARRIPISEGIVQGHVSPEKAAQLGFKPNGTPLTFVSTPARRVLISDEPVPSTSKLNNVRLGSPVRTSPKQRERSAEPISRLGESTKGKEKASVLKIPANVLSKLPFPLVPAEAQFPQALAQDEANKVKFSPFKSNLKQPTSRIPRIGAKPYARSVDVKPAEKTNQTTTPRMVDLAKPSPKPSIVENARRSVRPPDSSKTSAVTSSRVKPTTPASVAMLKRKREPEKPPAKPRVVILRRVPPVATAPNEASTSAQTSTSMSSTVSIPVKNTKPSQGSVRIRRVMDPEPPVARQVTPPPAPPPEPETELPTIVVNPPRAAKDPATSKASSPHLMNLDEAMPESVPEKVPHESTITLVQPSEINTPSDTVFVAPLPTPTVTITDYSAIDLPTSGLRRTTRSRRTVNNTDVFSESSSRPVSSSGRRKPSTFRTDDIFAGMSITALKDLTTSNTVHNQKYLAANLETEVIHREGVRPESPAMKVRTVSQRQQDERERQRSERAKRRSRRSGELPSSDVEGSSDVGYSSLGEELMSEGEQEIVKHQRGAGDEEDYATPERPKLKRTRLFEDPDTQEPEPPKRRVKWDRGLFTTVYLDEVQLGSRQTVKENMSLKGILAPTAKALRLDTLGNLSYADTPLSDLVQENITVKKIVYDSDVVEAEIVVKNTRAKKKK